MTKLKNAHWMKLKEVKIDHIAKTLKKNDGNKTRAAEDLGISTTGLRKFVRNHKEHPKIKKFWQDNRHTNGKRQFWKV